MIKKALVITSFATGYVLGAQAGRERYEQIRRIALGIKNDPHVQEVAGEAAELVREHGASLVDKVTPGSDAGPTFTSTDGRSTASIDGTASINPVGSQRGPSESEILGPQGTSYSDDPLTRTLRS
ncbi:MAG: hypothetical protein JWQ74_3038 [Marmoricola sp.]|nr:hypothetical protein [Marmoricola sp.]